MRKVVRKSAKKSKPNVMRAILGFVLLLMLPLITVIAVQQRQDIRQRAQTAPPPVTINIVDFSFNPGMITVPVGTRVTWINRSTAGVPHTSSSDATGTANSWDSGILNPGGQFSRTFTTAGTFNYHCNVHGAGVMSGRIIVVPNTTGPTSPNTNPPTSAPGELEPSQGPNNPYVTPTKPVVKYSTPTPPPYGGSDKPVYTCLGSCPTPTPTPYTPPAYEAPARGGYYPTPTPKYAYAAPTKVMAYYPTPTPKPLAYGYAKPTAAKLAKATPCPVRYNASDNTNISPAPQPAPANEEGGLFNKIIDLILQLFFKILEMLFGVTPPQKQQVSPAPKSAPGQLEQKAAPKNPGQPVVVAPC